MSFDTHRSADYLETAASGYGYTRYVDCNSALALIGFILFIDLLRDIIEDVTMPMRRKRRWATENGKWRGQNRGWEIEPDLLTFVSEGGHDHLYHTLPGILSPLMREWVEEGEQCRELGVCQVNRALTSQYGTGGRVIATLISNVASRALSGGDDGVAMAILRAAKEGRHLDHTSCHATFPHCTSPHHHHNVTTPHTSPNSITGDDPPKSDQVILK